MRAAPAASRLKRAVIALTDAQTQTMSFAKVVRLSGIRPTKPAAHHARDATLRVTQQSQPRTGEVCDDELHGKASAFD